MRTFYVGRRNPVTCAGIPSRGLVLADIVRGRCRRRLPHSSTFLRPLAPPALPGFNATMDALTSDPGLSRRGPSMVRSVDARRNIQAQAHSGTAHLLQPYLSVGADSQQDRISLFNVCKLPAVLSPTTHDRPRSLVCFYFRGLPRDLAGTTKATPVPVGRIVTWASPLASRLATIIGRIEFVVILRTSRSPPVAPHPALRRRSYLRLQCPDRTLAGTCTLPIAHTHRRTSPAFQRVSTPGSTTCRFCGVALATLDSNNASRHNSSVADATPGLRRIAIPALKRVETPG